MVMCDKSCSCKECCLRYLESVKELIEYGENGEMSWGEVCKGIKRLQ